MCFKYGLQRNEHDPGRNAPRTRWRVPSGRVMVKCPGGCDNKIKIVAKYIHTWLDIMYSNLFIIDAVKCVDNVACHLYFHISVCFFHFFNS